MPSYGYGYTKYVESEQGNLTLGDVTSGHIYFNIVPTSFYYFNNLKWYEDNDLLFYSSDYPSPTSNIFPNYFTIGKIAGTTIFGALYITDPDIPSGTPLNPIMIEQDKIRFCIFSGDFNGEQTQANPTGARIAQYSQFNPCKTYTEYYENMAGQETYRTTHHAADDYYCFFGVLDSGNKLYLFDAPLKKEEVVEISVNLPLIEETHHNLAFSGELNSWEEFYAMHGIDILNVNNEQIEIEDLPEQVDTSGTGGGGGTFDMSSVDILLPNLPTLGAANSGMVTMYNPSISELRRLSDWLWSNDLLDSLEKMFAQPLDLIISLSISPVPPYSLGQSQNVKIGGVNTGISMTKINNQYAILDCGWLNVAEYYGSALDYGQYTKVSLYLPFINTVTLKTDEVMNARLRVVYYCDLFSGSCVAFVIVKRPNMESILYSFEGNMAVTLPLISRDFSNIYSAIAKTGISALSGGVSLMQAPDSAMSVMSSKPNVNRSGGATATGGLLGYKYPYLIIERPIQSLASGYNKYVGYPSNITAKLSSLRGYTEIEDVRATTLSCTKEEQDAIIARLKEGVII